MTEMDIFIHLHPAVVLPNRLVFKSFNAFPPLCFRSGVWSIILCFNVVYLLRAERELRPLEAIMVPKRFITNNKVL